MIRNFDVASYYPHQMVLNGYCSRNIPSPAVYAETIERRVKAKKSGDKATANALKLVLNTTYGAMLNAYNPLYDPLMGRSVCISGQLQLLELAEHLVKDCRTLKLIQLNTDGIMISFDENEYSTVLDITGEWQTRTGFELEEDSVKKIIQKDVNGYLEVPLTGEPKIKGGVLVRGISPAGAFNINNNATIVALAVKNYLAYGVSPETTINNCDDVLSYQFISKASAKYSMCYHEINGQLVETQKVNRVYAVNDYQYGTLYKKHKETGVIAKISNLPMCCKVDNNNEIKISEINKDWYIGLAKRYIADFLGEETANLNARQIKRQQKQILKILEENNGNN